ncbi:MAG: hypothetical protein ACREQ4_10860 [Candidatus Binataceae bacterium]
MGLLSADRNYGKPSAALPRESAWQDRFGLFSFAIYLALAILFFARALNDPSRIYIGRTADPSVYMWSMVWWPHALLNRLNPFITQAVWAPSGFNLTWTTSMPLASLLMAPLTWHFGPVAAYNVLCLLSPALAGWAAFLLCREAGAEYWPALAGGYLFGFSAYMLAELRAHVVLALVFPVALAAWLMLRRLRQRIGIRAFVIALALVLIAEAGFELELFATMSLFGGCALLIGHGFADSQTRIRIRGLILPLVCSYAIVAVLMMPYLYYFFQPGFPRVPINSPKAYSTDLLNLFIPTTVNQLGTLGIFKNMARHFPGALIETGGYIGLPLMAVAAAFLYLRRHTRASKALIVFLIVTLIAALGPRLHLDGWVLFGLPWKIAGHVPLIDNALPARFMLFAFLALAVVLAQWLSDRGPNLWVRIAGIVLIAASMLPNLSAGFWTRAANTPAFFTSGLYRNQLARDENVIVLPYGASGNSMLWQAETHMYFRMAGGWTSITPRAFESWPIVDALWSDTSLPDGAMQLKAFMAAHDVSAVLVADSERNLWVPLLDSLDPSPRDFGGITVYRPAPATLNQWRAASAFQMQRVATAARLKELVVAAQKYLANGGDPHKLTPIAVERLGLLPPGRVPIGAHADGSVRTHNGLYLGPWKNGRIAVGVTGSYAVLKPLIERLRGVASQVYYPFPHELGKRPRGDTFMRMLVMTFAPRSLPPAAALIANP